MHRLIKQDLPWEGNLVEAPYMVLGDWFVYHAWFPAQVGTDPKGRTMWLSRLTWNGDTPVVQPPLRNKPTEA